MFRIIATLLDILSGVFAVLAPLAVVHWIVGAFEIPDIRPVMTLLTQIFSPMNSLVDAAIPMELPAITYQEKAFPVTQGVLAFILTGSFFLCAAGANGIRTLEKKLAINRDLMRQHIRSQQQASQAQEKKQKTLAQSTIIAYLLFPFDNQKQAADILCGFAAFGGKLADTRAEGKLILFEEPKKALQYAAEVGSKVVQYYATLRPMDPQPPFQIALHAIKPGNDQILPGLSKCQLLIRYTGENQVVFSTLVMDLMKAHGLNEDYKFQSIGLYDFGEGKEQEMFRLFFSK